MLSSTQLFHCISRENTAFAHRGCPQTAQVQVAHLERGRGGVDEVLRLLLHPLLVVELDVLLVLPAAAVRLPHGRGVVRQVRVAVVAKVFRHLD